VLIRDATDNDWPAIYPIFASVVQEGRTYAYPEDLSSDAARELWMMNKHEDVPSSVELGWRPVDR